MKKILVLLFLSLSLFCFSQTKDDNKIRIQSSINIKEEPYQPYFNKKYTFYSIKLEAAYSINTLIEIGVFGSKSLYQDAFRKLNSAYNTFGISAKVHLLPIFIDTKSRCDVYVPLGIGISSLVHPNNIVENESYPEYFGGIGTSLNIYKNIGVFANYIFENKVQKKFKPYLFGGINVVL